ncbi:hypothetical protein GLOIN_2v1778669 [Rhizophagus irregularis DAOM 181602=DAOM 197198]|nr:hypothetical protein GLOIN_2v1778669 [Rhizophagus irregularis DAOM 181602=DAOM 197198]
MFYGVNLTQSCEFGELAKGTAPGLEYRPANSGITKLKEYFQRLIIINKTDNVNEGIIELIKVQKNLSYFEWKDDFEDEYDIINVPYNEILLDIINHLILYFQLLYYQEYQEHKLFEIFPIFHELKTLKVYFGLADFLNI